MNFAGYQSLWFIAILGGQSFEWVLLLLILLHLTLCNDWKTETKIILSCAAIGISIDSAFALQGLYQFSEEPNYLPIPLWLVGIWLGFISTLRHSLDFMRKKPLLMTMSAGLSAPLTYMAGMRLGAVEFPLGTPLSLMCIGLAWMGMVPIFIRICCFFERGQRKSIRISSARSHSVTGNQK